MSSTPDPIMGTGPEFFKKWALEKKLGAGAFGQVRACVRTEQAADCDEKFAVKIIDFQSREPKPDAKKKTSSTRLAFLFGNADVDTTGTKAMQAGVLREVKTWTMCAGNEHIVQIHEAYLDSNFGYMVMEVCRGTVIDMIEQSDPVEEEILGIAIQMLKALQRVHSVRIVHRDVKPANFLAGGANGCVVKLCDFGLAAIVPRKKMLLNTAGTAPFMAPEMLCGYGYTSIADVWSLGATLYLMLFGEFPHEPEGGKRSSADMKQAIRDNSPKPRFEAIGDCPKLSPEIKALLRRLIHRDPRRRLSAEKALKTEIVQEFLYQPPQPSLERNSVQSAFTYSTKLVRSKTQEFRLAADPTRTRNVDEILGDLESRWGGRSTSRFHQRRASNSEIDARRLSRSFSLPAKSQGLSFEAKSSNGSQVDSTDENTTGQYLMIKRMSENIHTHGGTLDNDDLVLDVRASYYSSEGSQEKVPGGALLQEIPFGLTEAATQSYPMDRGEDTLWTRQMSGGSTSTCPSLAAEIPLGGINKVKKPRSSIHVIIP